MSRTVTGPAIGGVGRINRAERRMVCCVSFGGELDIVARDVMEEDAWFG